MRDLLMFVSCNCIAIILMCGKPSIKNKFIFYTVPLLLMGATFLKLYMKSSWWIKSGFDDYNLGVIAITLIISLYFRRRQINDKKQQKDLDRAD